MTNCPCCSYRMVRRIERHQTVWFCRHCWQDMPNFAALNTASLVKGKSLEQAIQQQNTQNLLLMI